MKPNKDLAPLAPGDALDKYIEHHKSEHTDSTLQSHRYRLNHLVRWCDEQGIDSLHELSPRDLQDYRSWRRDDGDLNTVSMYTQMSTLRVFMKWAENYEAVPTGLHERVDVPTLDRGEDARDRVFGEERAEAILNYLSTYRYASKHHALFTLLWNTGIRIGAARALDQRDFHSDDEYIELHHRPESDTPLKNKEHGERPVALTVREAEVLAEYIDVSRPDVTDDYGREPLFATREGRPHLTTIRGWVYQLARPCVYRNGACPHDRDPDECLAARDVDDASKCPSSFSPHDIRRSSITYWLGEDAPATAISDRMNVDEKVLDQHYDKRTGEEKMSQRRKFFQ